MTSSFLGCLDTNTAKDRPQDIHWHSKAFSESDSSPQLVTEQVDGMVWLDQG